MPLYLANKKETFFKKLIVFLSSIFFLGMFILPADAQPIRFSNIGNTKTSLPELSRDILYYGIEVNGHTMIRMDHLAYALGGTLSTNPQNPDEWRITRNGQTVKFYKDSTIYATDLYYTLINPATSGSSNFWISFNGTTPVATQLINGYRYVHLNTATHQLGVLIIGTSGNEARVFDFRVDGGAVFADSNVYVVGGPWNLNWNNQSSKKLSFWFTLGELWDKSSSYYYSKQLKMSVNQLQSAENVRYHYNDGQPMTITSGFRSWPHNNATSGSWVRSFHLRGRAWDASGSNLYTKVYDEFKGVYSTPIDPGGNFWRTRVSNGLSLGHEIEKMPTGGSTWLHLQRPPQYGSVQ